MAEEAGTHPLPELPNLPEKTPFAPHETQLGHCDGGIPINIRITSDGATGRCPGVCGQQTTWIVGFLVLKDIVEAIGYSEVKLRILSSLYPSYVVNSVTVVTRLTT
ncbi:hypothetical protein HZC09_03095 [Candidatus Micrarchaeota archaeon]|nr:hypothetical protein [Candidatus Micrarchaeota archaeon]